MKTKKKPNKADLPPRGPCPVQGNGRERRNGQRVISVPYPTLIERLKNAYREAQEVWT